MDSDALIKAGVIRRARDGVRILGQGELTVGLDIRCHSATAGARKVIEAAGGKLTTTVVVAEAEAPAAEG